MPKIRLFQKIFVLSLIALMVSLSFVVVPNNISPTFWKQATLQDVEKRFKAYRHFNRYDKEGRTLLMLALQYSENPDIPTYFLLRADDVKHVDAGGKTAYDYAMLNPKMQKLAAAIYELQHLDFSELEKNKLEEKTRPLRPFEKYQQKKKLLGLNTEDNPPPSPEKEKSKHEKVKLSPMIIRKILQKHEAKS